MNYICVEAKQPALLSEVKRLADELLGFNYLSDNQICQISQEPKHKLLACIGDHQLIAFSIASIQKNEENKKIFETFDVHPPHSADHQRIGYMRTAAVSPLWQRRGIGLEMAKQRVEWLREHGCTYLYAVSWEHDGPTSKSVLEKVGFTSIAYKEGLFEKATPGCDCPRCAPQRCSCGGHLLVRDV